MGKYYRTFRIIIIWLYAAMSAIFLVASFFFLLESTSSFFELINALLQVKEKLARFFGKYALFAGSIIMMVFVGIPQLISSLFVIARMKRGIIFSIMAAVLLFFFSIILTIWFPADIFCYIILFISLIEMAVSILCLISYFQHHFYFNIDNYLKIGRNPDTLVVCYCNDIYMRKLSYEVADDLECDLYEIESFDKKYWNNDTEEENRKEEVDISLYRNIHFIFKLENGHLPVVIKDFIDNHSLKNKRIYIEIVSPRKGGLVKAKKEIKESLKHISGYFITKMSFGVVSERTKKTNL